MMRVEVHLSRDDIEGHSQSTHNHNLRNQTSLPSKVKSPDAFVLTRRSTIRSNNTRADDSPASLTVDSSLRKKLRNPDSTMSVASHSTPTTAYSSSSSQSTRGGNDTIYSKPDDEFSEHASLGSSSRRRRRQQQGTTQKAAPTRDHLSMFTLARDEESTSASAQVLGNHTDTEERHSYDDSDSESSAALDAFLDTRLKSLLEAPEEETDQDQPGIIQRKNSAAHLPNGTQDDPVDLTALYSTRLNNRSAGVSDEKKETTTPTRSGRPTLSQSEHLTPQRKPDRVAAASERNTTIPRSPYQASRRRRRNSQVSPQPPSATTGSTTPKQQQLESAQQKMTFPRLSSVSLSSSVHAASRGSSFFNPLLTGTSPGRGMRRSSFMVGGMFTTSQSAGNLAYARQLQEKYDDDDASSIDSLELLEMWSHQIQTELRHEAMVEVALEAERAAESGQERFSSNRPWVYGKDEDEESPSPQHSIKRVASYSEGVTPMRRASTSNRSILPIRRIPKVPVHELRDVDEVFPSLDVFHKNLRTHMARNNVDESCLIFEERERSEASGIRQPLGSSTTQAASAGDHQSWDSGIGRSSNNHARHSSFLESFSFDLLGTSSRNMVEEKKSNEHEDGIGDILADHIQSAEGQPRVPPKRETLPGLEDLNIHLSISNKATPPKPSSPKRHQSISKEEAPSPRALFDNEENDTQTLSDLESLEGHQLGDNSSIVSETPLTDRNIPDFVTPAKLRRIRRKDVPNDSTLLAVSSILATKSPHTVEGVRRPNHDPTSPAGSDKTPPALLLPTLPHGEDHSPASRNSSLRPAVTRKPKFQHSRSMSADSEILECDDDYMAREGDSKARIRRLRFKNIFANGSKSRSSKAPTQDLVPLLNDADHPDHAQFDIEPSPSIEYEESHHPPQEITTPAYADCNCLSLSPTPSLDEFGIPRGRGAREVRRADSPEPFAAAMKMISHHLSPRQEKQRRKHLYVGLKQNDDFMQNFLYCGKRMGPPKAPVPDSGISNRICGDDRCEDGVAAMANTCYATFVLDDDNELVQESALNGCAPAIQGGQSGGHSLFGQTPAQKLEPDTWFDVATEKVDGVIERLVGTTPRNEWNLSFQPPSLRKNTGNSAFSDGVRSRRSMSSYKGTLDPMEETVLDASLSPGSSVQQVSAGSVHTMSPRPSTPPVVALFPSPGHDLSDDQFQLIYGMSRTDHENLLGRQERTPHVQRNQTTLQHLSAKPRRPTGQGLNQLSMPLPRLRSDSGVEEQTTYRQAAEQLLAMTKSY